MANVVGRVPVGADTRPLENDISAALSKNYQLKGLNEKAFSQPLGRITGAVDEFRKSLDASNARVLAFGASAGAIFAVQKGFESLISSTIKVQKNLTDINSILGLSGKSLQGFGDQLFKIAGDTGQSFDTISQAAAEFSRQGLGVAETLKRTRDALILTRLSGLDVVSSTEALTATINSFNKVALDSTEIVNKLATVDAAFAVSSADLAEAIQRVGSSAEGVGVNFDQLIALVTSVQQTTARGGAVIGNSLKTIFTRLERTEVLDQLESLNIQVRNLDGSFRPAIDTLSQLAQRFDGLSDAQKSNVAELVGGVFQINILKAALGDLGKQYSIYNSALDTSSAATDTAVKRNEQLNQTFAALINKTSANFTKLASDIGGLTLGPAIQNVLGNINGALESVNIGDAKGPGEKLAKGLLEGLGNYISGPGLALVGAVIGKLFVNLAKFSSQAVGQILEINKGSQQQVEIQQRVNNLLSQNPNLIQGILSKEISLLAVENDILKVIQQQTVAREQSARISNTIAGNLIGRGVVSTGGKISAKSGGFIPNFASPEQTEVYGAYLGGYKPGAISRMNIPGAGQVVYNQAEQVKQFPGMSQPAIMPPQGSGAGRNYAEAFQKKLGFNPYAAMGYIPNFASISTVLKEAGISSLKEAQDYKVKGTKAYEINGITIRQSELERAFSTKRAQAKLLDASNLATMLVPPEGKTKSIQERLTKIDGEDILVRWPVRSYDRKKKDGTTIQDIEKISKQAMAQATEAYITSIDPPAQKPQPEELINALDTTAGAKGAITAAAGAAFEVGLRLALGVPEASVEGINFDVMGPPNQKLAALFGYNTPLADFKINDHSADNVKSMSDKIISASGVLPKSALKEGGAGLVENYINKNKKTASRGFIPNYSPLANSVAREVSAGVSPSSIRVGQDSRLSSSENPLGLGVYNTKDEPAGLGQGIARFKNVFSARKSGAALGFIPNFAPFNFEVGGLGALDTKVANQEIRQKLISIKEKLARQEISVQEANIEADKVAKEYGVTAQSAKRISNIATVGAKQGFGQKLRNFSNSPAALGASIALPVLGGAISSALPENATVGKSIVNGVSSAASFALTGAQLGGAPGAIIGGLIGGVTALVDIQKQIKEEPIIKLGKQIELSQEKLNKLNDSFSRFNSITEKISDAMSGNAKLNEQDLAKLQAEQAATLSEVPQEFRDALMQALAKGDKFQVQQIETQVIQSQQGVVQAQQAEKALREYNLSQEPGNMDYVMATLRNYATAQAGQMGGPIKPMVTPQEERAAYLKENPEAIAKQKAALDEAVKALPRQMTSLSKTVAQIIVENFGKSPEEIKNILKNLKPEGIDQASWEELISKYLGIENVQNAIEKAKKSNAIAGANTQIVKDAVNKFITATTNTAIEINKRFSESETLITNSTNQLQSSKSKILELTKIFAGEFALTDITANFDKILVDAQAAQQKLGARQTVIQKLTEIGAGVADKFRASDTSNTDIIKGLNKIDEARAKVVSEFQISPEAGRKAALDASQELITFSKDLTQGNSEIKSSVLDIANNFSEIGNKTLPDFMNKMDSISKTQEASKKTIEEETLARKKLISITQSLSFGGGIEGFKRTDFFQKAQQFTSSQGMLGSKNTILQGQGALNILDTLREFKIGPNNKSQLPAGLYEQALSGITADLQRKASFFGIKTGPDQLKQIAENQLNANQKFDDAISTSIPNIEQSSSAFFDVILNEGIAIQSASIKEMADQIAAGITGEGGLAPGASTGGEGVVNGNVAAQTGVKNAINTSARVNAFNQLQQSFLQTKLNTEQQKRAVADTTYPSEVQSKTAAEFLSKSLDLSRQNRTEETLRNALMGDMLNSTTQMTNSLEDQANADRIVTEAKDAQAKLVQQLMDNQITTTDYLTQQKSLQQDIALQVERTAEKEKLIRDYKQDQKDLASGYLSSTEYANRSLQRQQDLARLNPKAYNPLTGSAQSFVNQMSYNGTQFFQDLNTSAVDVAKNIQDSFSNAFQAFANGTVSAGDAFNNFAIQILDQISQISSQLATKLLFGGIFNQLQGALGGSNMGILGGLFGGGMAKGGLVKGYASGGYVAGGSGVVDDVPAMLSKGEYVLNRRAVKSLQQGYGMGFLQSLNSGSTGKYADGGVAFQQELENKYVVSGFQNTSGLNTKDIGQGISALQAYMSQMKGEAKIDPKLTNYALTDETNRANAERMQTEQNYYDYQSYLNDSLNQNIYTKAQAEYVYQQQLDAYNRKQKQSMQAAYINAGMAIGGSLLMGMGGGFGGGAAGGAGGIGGSIGGSSGFGASFGMGSAGTAVASSTGAAGGGLFGMSPMMSQLAAVGLLGAGAVGAPMLASMLGGGSSYSNTRKQGSSSSGLQYSNRFKFAEGGMAQDDVPALLMNGEYVVSKDAVQKYGSNFFDKLNRGNIGKFANGGQVGPINESKNPDIIEQMVSDSTINNNNTSINNQTQSSDLAEALSSLNDTLSKNTSNEGMVNNINISINIESDGNVSQTKSSNSNKEDQNGNDDTNKTSGQKMKALTEMIKENTIKTIIEQKRPGGLLAKGSA
jgi:TP901 family phage tail tape measure protein